MPRHFLVLLVSLPWLAAADEPATVPVESTCPAPISIASFTQTLQDGETAFVQMNKEGIERVEQAATESVACLTEQIAPSEAARFHRLLALAAFVRKDRELAKTELCVSRRLEPLYVFPEGLVSAEHPLSRLYEQAKAEELIGEFHTVLAPVGGWATVDGVRTDARLSTVSAIVQIVDARGVVVESYYVRPLDLLPTVDLTPYNLNLTAPEPQSIFQSSPKPWLIATATSLTISGGLYAVGMIEKGRYEDIENPVPDSELPTLQNTTNALGVAWVASSAVTVGLGLVTFTVVIPNHNKGE